MRSQILFSPKSVKEPAAKDSFEEFQKVWERSNLVQDAWYVALDRGKYVGMTELWSNQADPELFDIGVTGVLRPHRRRGIAMALKLRGIEFAQRRGDSGTAKVERVEK